MDSGPVYRFGRFVLDLERGCLQDGHLDLRLRPKSFEVLRNLVEHAGRLMAKDELVRAVWPDVVVSDDSLAHCIRDIRKVLDDRGEQFVKTVPRRGYTFVAPVDALEPGERRASDGGDAAPRIRTADPASFERGYRSSLNARYAEDAGYFVPLSARTSERRPDGPARAMRPVARRRRALRPEYQEWLQDGEELALVKLESLRDALERYRCVVLLGDPGCGKTSALGHLAFECSTHDHWLPITLSLGSFESSLSLEEFILSSWRNLLDADPDETRHLPDHLRRYLESGRLILLFDGLNELPLERRRERCVALRRFIDRWSPAGNRFVVSCRVLDYGEELSGLQRVEILPLGDEQIRQFIAKELPENWRALWQALTEGPSSSRRLLEMARNPYLLTVMIDVFDAHGELTRNRGELMRRFVGILIDWARAKSPAGEAIDAGVAATALATVAFEMQRRSGFGTTVRTEDVKTVIPRRIDTDRGWRPAACHPDRLLEFAARARIIETPVDRKTLRFSHQLLQEFFAAQHLLRLDPSRLASLWHWRWREDELPRWIRQENDFGPLPPPPSTGWEETTILAAGMASANRSLLVQVLGRVNPVLAVRCVLDGHAEVESDIRGALVDELRGAIADPGVALRVRIAAGEALGRLGDPRAGEMVAIPAGAFVMGDGDERHEVLLPEYRIGRYPVTNTEYARFVDAGGYSDASCWTAEGWEYVGKQRKEPRYWHDPRFSHPNQPVVGLSWYECVAYCRWLSAQTRCTYRLPTEAEWEKAARGTDGATYPWGEALDASRLNARDGDQKVYCSTPVGVYPAGASPFGLFDCAGNVWEWCATRWRKPFPYDAEEDEWNGSYCGGQGLRALRGGSWNYEMQVAKCAHRFRFEPYGWNDRAGFRLARAGSE